MFLSEEWRGNSAALLSDDPSAARPLYRQLRAQALAGGFAVLREHPCGPLRGSPTANVPYETFSRFFGSSRYEPSLRSPIRVHEAREVIAPPVARRFAAALRVGGYAYADTDRAATRRHSQSRSVGRADFDYVIKRLAPIGEKMSVLLA